MELAEFQKSLSSGLIETCERASWGECWPSKMVTQKWSEGDKIHLTCDHHAPGKATPIDRNPLLPGNLENTVSKLSGPGVAQLRSKLSGQFGVRRQSTGAKADQALTHIIMQTLDASPDNPYLVTFEQYIFNPFTDPGQFDLVERDAGDVDIFDADSGNAVTIATKSGFSGVTPVSGWSCFSRPVTSDKIYSVVFVPDSAGDGAYSISARTLIPLDPDRTPLPS